VSLTIHVFNLNRSLQINYNLCLWSFSLFICYRKQFGGYIYSTVKVQQRFGGVVLCVFALWVPCCDVRYEFRVVMSVMSSVLWCPLRFPHKNYVRFVFISGYLWEGSCLVYVICICLRVVVSNTCVFLGFSFFVLCGQFLWIVLFLLPLRCSLT
jgi:hypothetical protein